MRRGRAATAIAVLLALLLALAAWLLVRSSGAPPTHASREPASGAAEPTRADAALDPLDERASAAPTPSGRAVAIAAEEPAPAATDTRPQRVLDVLVVDALDRAVANLEVTAFRIGESGPARFVSDDMSVATDANGRARIPLGDAPEQMPNRASVDIASDTEVAVDIEPRHLAGEKLRIVTPVLGTVVVIVTDADGAPMHAPAQVYLCGDAPGARGTPLWGSFDPTTCMRRALERDRVRFEHVAVDCELRAVVRREGSAAEHVFADVGPRPRPAHLEIPLRLGALLPILTGRVVSASGAPFARRTLDAQLRGRLAGMRSRGCGQPTTDSDGVFRLDLQDSPSAIGGVEFALVAQTAGNDGDARLEARTKLALPLANGLVDLGTLVLEPPGVLLAGRVVDARGAPVEHARLQMYEPVHLHAEGEPAWWNEVGYAAGVRSDAHGAFSVRGSSSADKLAVRAHTDERASAAIEFEPGASGIEFVVRGFGGLRGRVLLEPASLADACTLRVFRTDVANRDYEQLSQERELAEDGRFAFHELAAGTWDARVTRRGDDEALATVAGLRIDEGVVLEDPRLDPLDLRGRLHVLHLDVVDAAGAPIEGARVHFRPTGADDGTHGRTRPIGRGAFALVVSELPIDLRIDADGYLSADFSAVRSDVRATLTRAPLLRFVLADPSKLPAPPIRLSPTLVALDGPEDDAHTASYAFDARGVLEMHATRTGRHRLRWHVQRRDQNIAFGRLVDPPAVLEFDVLPGGTSAQVVELDFDAAWIAEQAKALR